MCLVAYARERSGGNVCHFILVPIACPLLFLVVLSSPLNIPSRGLKQVELWIRNGTVGYVRRLYSWIALEIFLFILFSFTFFFSFHVGPYFPDPGADSDLSLRSFSLSGAPAIFRIFPTYQGCPWKTLLTIHSCQMQTTLQGTFPAAFHDSFSSN